MPLRPASVFTREARTATLLLLLQYETEPFQQHTRVFEVCVSPSVCLPAAGGWHQQLRPQSPTTFAVQHKICLWCTLLFL